MNITPLLLLFLLGCSEPKSDPTLEIARAVGRAANQIKVSERCPPIVNGKELSHSVWKESDTTDSVLHCFYRREK